MDTSSPSPSTSPIPPLSFPSHPTPPSASFQACILIANRACCPPPLTPSLTSSPVITYLASSTSYSLTRQSASAPSPPPLLSFPPTAPPQYISPSSLHVLNGKATKFSKLARLRRDICFISRHNIADHLHTTIIFSHFLFLNL